ncbi:Transglycosylase associated protein [Posidoniimonas polymericola]|uniref:Transglycosylase associated protein n=1 Tax=Posidoniimonas polymericola TaxID=2528002 RepID=A0A5C5ZE74_9BACT|nr:GlsB/YeaQ/YmgE family stress response membrane protein [Posidoniimonas polymericola]TWT85465.1 Transglycosylase associated protein [Posidoniimonas polymericola]
MSLLYWILIGLAAGWLASLLTKSSKPGLLGLLVVGMVGSMLGGTLIWLLGFSANTLLAELITATVGAVLLIVMLRRWVWGE